MTRFLLPLLALPAFAGESTVQTAPFRVEKSFNALAVPAEPGLFTLDPESWTSFTIESITDHGTSVKKGEVIVRFEREEYDRRVQDLTRALEMRQLELARKTTEVTTLKEETRMGLEAARRAKQEADADLAYYKESTEPALRRDEAHKIEVARFRLAAEEEELKQLQAMYDADDLTEETEEIILDRQKFAVEDAKLEVANTERNTAWVLETQLPRQLKSFELKAEEATLALAKAEKNLPAALRTAELELASLETAIERETLELQRLTKDAALFEWKAPADGVVFHGSLEDGTWSLGELAKSLVPGGAVPLKRPILSLATAGETLVSAQVDGPVAFQLKPGSPLAATLAGLENLQLTATIKEVATQPGTDGKFRVLLDLTWPEDFAPAPATWISCTATTHSADAALAVPNAALRADAGKWFVEVKLADGKTERREVTRGLSDGKSTEILGGLEPGQVVVTPE
ncbi:MAG: hypothetical protein MUF31_06500 [Akkermansiaceae bacterium]|jgi:hypothetical protein|nr:hypothetical protein [Akkermansiaceae bacterium]